MAPSTPSRPPSAHRLAASQRHMPRHRSMIRSSSPILNCRRCGLPRTATDAELRSIALPSVPQAARKDPGLYETHALFDALRGGAARERNLAAKLLDERFA